MTTIAKAAHTPGPWALDPNQRGLITADVDGLEVCWVDAKDRSPEENAANGRLVAAATEMLEALEDLIHAHETGMGPSATQLRVDLARAIVAKARGRQ